MGYYDEQKKARYERIKSITEEKGPLEETELIANLKVDMGLTEEKATEYVEDLKVAGDLEVDDGTVKVSD